MRYLGVESVRKSECHTGQGKRTWSRKNIYYITSERMLVPVRGEEDDRQLEPDGISSRYILMLGRQINLRFADFDHTAIFREIKRKFILRFHPSIQSESHTVPLAVSPRSVATVKWVDKCIQAEIAAPYSKRTERVVSDTVIIDRSGIF